MVVYRNSFSGLDAQTFSSDDRAMHRLSHSFGNVRWVRPLDSLCQYRLEMALRSLKQIYPITTFGVNESQILCVYVNALDTKYILNLMSASTAVSGLDEVYM